MGDCRGDGRATRLGNPTGVGFVSLVLSLAVMCVAPKLDWHREVWPLQWRIGVQSAVRYFAFYLFTPVMFAFHGAEVAGRMGMTWSILTNIQLAAFAWIRTRAPRYGELIARRDYATLDREFFRGLCVSLVAMLSALIVLVLTVIGLAHCGIPVLRSLAERFLEPPALLVFGAGLIPIHIAQCLSVYLRAHKQDPLLGIMVVSNTLIGLPCSGWAAAMGRWPPVGDSLPSRHLLRCPA